MDIEEQRRERARLTTMLKAYEQIEATAKAQQEYLKKKIGELDE